jgi:hypothetical protein
LSLFVHAVALSVRTPSDFFDLDYLDYIARARIAVQRDASSAAIASSPSD